MWQGVAERRCDDGGPLKLPTRFHASKPLAIGGASIDDTAGRATKEIGRAMTLDVRRWNSAFRDQTVARVASTAVRTRAPSARWPGFVHSSSLWLIPPWLGTKIMPVGHR